MSEPTQRPYHHGNLYTSMLDTAQEILQTEGISGITMREIAKRVGVSHSAAYRHFASKELLLARSDASPGGMPRTALPRQD